jgi:glycerol-3-phosphate dehydrogenase
MPPEHCGHAATEPKRERNVARLRGETFDLGIIGGGINGAAIARDAAMRGLSVALIDKGDFAGATSSRSSKLIHGGLRYLPQGQLRLVYQALHERERLRHLSAPHLVRPIRLLFPFYYGKSPGHFAVSMGLVLYDLLARMPRAERHRQLASDSVLRLEPSLTAERMNGGMIYYDAWGDDARLTIENVLDAAFHGAAVANYVALEGFSHAGSRIGAAAVRDLESGASFEIRARMFVNAAGPWVDDVRRMDDPARTPSVRLTKGVHLVVAAARLPVRNALVLTDGGGRIVFVMPHGDYVLVGTTDTDFDGDRERVAPDPCDIDYLIEVIAQSLPEFRFSENEVAYSFAGLRALVTSSGSIGPSAVPREEIILEDVSGLVTIAGGKLTTHRRIAERVVDRVMKRLGRPAGHCRTLNTPLPGARTEGNSSLGIDDLPEDIRATLSGRYGTRAAQVERIAIDDAELAKPLAPGTPAIGAEVIFAVSNEFARSVCDFIVRRTSLIWRAPAAAIAAAPATARLMAAEFGWDRAREQSEIDVFLKFAAPRGFDPHADVRT